ncbi:hypothetical protein JCM14244_11260 [Venenivibrio stagnispumantis]|uniref:Protein involved in polysaccharide export, contains SLBB domain of the beta-grasp fold n=1 Tax=Venenivibrio stagnispumantis TaxID=407998 RepID=A0AA45WN71_9AQUI|nr:SLBB domain-containing protein [Venenivibrio stagnispumantis]MCW4573189.1 SLBB domain-containing protein [Venenivibrio stagnispumantis]SMP17678.1 protein involved in polysaccharide export, contains SLBB domain of the beta-grasp fold [Venenivibrio stagnispumantis]
MKRILFMVLILFSIFGLAISEEPMGTNIQTLPSLKQLQDKNITPPNLQTQNQPALENQKSQNYKSSQEMQTEEGSENKQNNEENLNIEKKIKEKEKPTLSNIEQLYNQRIENPKEIIYQYGYDFFSSYQVYEMGSLGDSYTIGPKDKLLLYIWGDPVDILGLSGFYSLDVDREGKVYIPNLGVFYVWGLTVEKAKELLKAQFAKKFKNFRIELSIGKLRQYPVYVSGYVKKPGMVLINATQSVLDAIALAGGIAKNGSLRNITIVRANGERENIDLYDLLIKGNPINIKLKENDAVLVNPIGKTAAIYGAVKRPAIYELKDNENLTQLINYAGGMLPSSYEYGLKIYRYEDNILHLIDTRIDEQILTKISLKDGDLVNIVSIVNAKENIVKVEGYVKYPGDYSLKDYPTLSKLLDKIGLLADANLNYAEIVRFENNDYQIIKIKPLDIINGKTDIELKNLDKVVFFPKWMYSPIEVSGEIENPTVIDYYPNITLLDALRTIIFKKPVRNLKAEVFDSSSEIGNKLDTNLRTQNELNNPMKYQNKYLQNYQNYNNETYQNYQYQNYDNQAINKNNANFKVIYLYDLLIRNDNSLNIPLKPGMKIVIKETNETEKDKTVTILGEVNKPGLYKLESGMKLYDLIVKAGGYTADAYPKALIFIRESAKKLQQEQLQASILAMEEQLEKSSEGFAAAGATQEEQTLAKMAIEKQKNLLEIIKQKAKIGLGRIALDIPLTLEELKNSPDNIELQDGDYIYIPSKPNYILVLGDVYNQISLPYRENKTVEDYLNEVGGLKDSAKKDDIYIIKANGRVISNRNFSGRFFGWEDNKFVFGRSFYSMKLEQGDTIVVPSEIKVPILWRPLIKDVTQIIFQAISTAVLAKRL